MAWGEPASAQSVDYTGAEQLFGEPVTTSATGKPQRASQVPANMEIITADDIRRSGADNFADVLQFVAGLDVRSFEDLESIVTEHDVSIGVIATPAVAAQSVADRMVATGITSILNFAPAVLSVPYGVGVRKVDLSIELQILAYHEQRKALARPLAGAIKDLTDVHELAADRPAVGS